MCCKYLVNLQHDCIVAVAVVSQVVVHVVDWVLHTWSLMPHTTNWVVDNGKEPCHLPLLPLIIMLLQILLLLMLSIMFLKIYIVAADPGYLPLIILSLKMLSLQLSDPASCLSYHAVEDVAAADAEPGTPSHPIVADVIAVDVEPRVLLPIMLLLLLLLY